jgi:hypothetical protein
MSYLLDIFNRRQPAPVSTMGGVGLEQAAPFVQTMNLPGGGPNTGAPMPTAPNFVGEVGQVPPMDVATAIACGIPPSQINRGPGGNAQNNPMPQISGAPAFNLPPNVNVSGPQQMPAFQPPQPMPFTNRPMPQFGAPNFSFQGGMTAAPQPSPFNGMMKGMFGVR